MKPQRAQRNTLCSQEKNFRQGYPAFQGEGHGRIIEFRSLQ